MDRCDTCRFDYADVHRAEVAGRLRTLVAALVAELHRADRDGLARQRPRPQTWSALEYACHVRDVLDVQRERVAITQRDAAPVFASMRRDERAIEERYNDQEIAAVATQLDCAAAAFVSATADLDDDGWARGGIYPWPTPTRRDVLWIARHTIHEVLHHVGDVREGIAALRGDPDTNPG